MQLTPIFSTLPLLSICVPVQGYEIAKKDLLEFLDGFKEAIDPSDRETLRCVARTALRTKLREGLADQLTDIVVDAVMTINKADQPLDLYMVREQRRMGVGYKSAITLLLAVLGTNSEGFRGQAMSLLGLWGAAAVPPSAIPATVPRSSLAPPL